eukprot:TRINITY_DN4828_c0_g4_i1.p1 TRINITY_DN4828_c0_g4~~TRINITY_DN4828_c0_g4_i1.p1  ORF type:complete len:1215 (+),score=257.42 TRINITY_DN4828_c0_g4_i1:149-3793(+)
MDNEGGSMLDQGKGKAPDTPNSDAPLQIVVLDQEHSMDNGLPTTLSWKDLHPNTPKEERYDSKPPKPRARNRKRPRSRWRKIFKRLKKRVRAFLTSPIWSAIMTLAIIYIIFVDDAITVNHAVRTNELQFGIGVSKVIVICLFTLEFLLNVFSNWKHNYNWKSLYFYLDLLAILSLIPDLLAFFGSTALARQVSGLAIARTGRAARASGRLARLFRLTKLYSFSEKWRKFFTKEPPRNHKEFEMDELTKAQVGGGGHYDIEPSKIGNRLINYTTTKIILIVLILLFCSDTLQAPIDDTPFVLSGLNALEKVYAIDGYDSPAFASAVSQYTSDATILFLRVDNYLLFDDSTKTDQLFDSSIQRFNVTGGSAVAYDVSATVVTQAKYSIALLCIVVFLLAVGNLLISRDAHVIVISPMERVLAILKQLSYSLQHTGMVGRRRSRSRNRRGSRSIRRTSSVSSAVSVSSSSPLVEANSLNTSASEGGGLSSEDTSGLTDDDDDENADIEADQLFGMLDSVGNSMKETNERVEALAKQNRKMQCRVDDLSSERSLLELRVRGWKRMWNSEISKMQREIEHKDKELQTIKDTRVVANLEDTSKEGDETVNEADIEATITETNNNEQNDENTNSNNNNTNNNNSSNDNDYSIEQVQHFLNGQLENLVRLAQVEPLSDVLLSILSLCFMPGGVPRSNLDFGLTIGRKKFVKLTDVDGTDIKFVHSLDITGKPTALTQYPQIKAASLSRLVERLSFEDYLDVEYVKVFLMTFRAYIPPLELFERLLVRYCITPELELKFLESKNANLSNPDRGVEGPRGEPANYTEWRRTRQCNIRTHILTVIKMWIENWYIDFATNPELLRYFQEIILDSGLLLDTYTHSMVVQDETGDLEIDLLMGRGEEDPGVARSERFKHLVQAKSSQYVQSVYRPPELDLEMSDEASLMREPEEPSLFALFETQVIAENMTLLEFELFKSIQPQELLSQSWVKRGKETNSPNVLRFIDHFNKVSRWVVTQVVRYHKLKDRIYMIKKMIVLAEEFLKIHNFSGAMEILAGLSNASVSRLKTTWEGLDDKYHKSFEELGSLMSSQSSYKLYRERLNRSPPPRLPYIGVFLSDLVFIDEGNSDYCEDALVNMEKQFLVASAIRHIMDTQLVNYSFIPVPEITQYLFELKGVSDSVAYQMSLIAEPRKTALQSASSTGSGLMQRIRSMSISALAMSQLSNT